MLLYLHAGLQQLPLELRGHRLLAKDQPVLLPAGQDDKDQKSNGQQYDDDTAHRHYSRKESILPVGDL
jgi:hypothetical protein